MAPALRPAGPLVIKLQPVLHSWVPGPRSEGPQKGLGVGVGGAVKQAMCLTSEVGVRKTAYRPGLRAPGESPDPGHVSLAWVRSLSRG